MRRSCSRSIFAAPGGKAGRQTAALWATVGIKSIDLGGKRDGGEDEDRDSEAGNGRSGR